MYDMVTNMVNEVHDGKTGQFLGYATFELSQPEEEKLLQLISYGKIPESLILSNVDIIHTAKDYVPPKLIEKLSRKGVLHALLRDENSGVLTPVEMQFTFDVRGRGRQGENSYHFDSAEYSNIKVDRIIQS